MDAVVSDTEHRRPEPIPQPTVFAPERAVPPRRASLRDILTPIFYHSRLIRNCLLLGLLVGVVAAAFSRPSFNANALLLVLIGPDSMSAQDAAGINPTVITIEGLKVVQSEIQIIQSTPVLRSAVQQVGASTIYPSLAEPRWFGLGPPRSPDVQAGEATQRLHADLHAEAETGTIVVPI